MDKGNNLEDDQVIMQESMRMDSLRSKQDDSESMNNTFKNLLKDRVVRASADTAYAKKDEELKFSGVNFDYLACRRLQQRKLTQKCKVGSHSHVTFEDAMDEDKVVNEIADEDE